MSKWWQEERNKWEVRTKAPTTKNPLVVTQPVNKPFNPKVQQPNLPQKTVSVAPITKTSTGYNPQQTVGPGGTYNPQDATAILQPQKSIRQFTSYRYDPQAGRLVEVNHVESLTDSQWAKQELENKIAYQTSRLFEDLWKSSRNDLNYKSDVNHLAWNLQNQLSADFQLGYEEMNKERAELNQMKSDVNYAHVLPEINLALEELDTQYSEWISTEISVSNNINSQSKAIMDRGHEGIWGELGAIKTPMTNVAGEKVDLSTIFRMTIGGGTETVPSLITLGTRTINFLSNVRDPTRVTQRDNVRSDEGIPGGWNSSVADRWKYSYRQATTLNSEIATTGQILGMNDMVADFLWTTVHTEPYSYKPAPEEYKGYDVVADFMVAEGLDPVNYVGAKGARAIKAAVAASRAGKGAKAVKSALLGSKTMAKVSATKPAKALKWLGSKSTGGTSKARASFKKGDVYDEFGQMLTGLKQEKASAYSAIETAGAGIRKFKKDTRQSFEKLFRKFEWRDDPADMRKYLLHRSEGSKWTNKSRYAGESDDLFKERMDFWNDMDKKLDSWADEVRLQELKTGDPDLYSDFMSKYFPKIEARKTSKRDYTTKSKSSELIEGREASKLGEPAEGKAGFTFRRQDKGKGQKPVIAATSRGSKSVWSKERFKRSDIFSPENQKFLMKEIDDIVGTIGYKKQKSLWKEFQGKYDLSIDEIKELKKVYTTTNKKADRTRLLRATTDTFSRRTVQSQRLTKSGHYGDLDKASKKLDDLGHEIPATYAQREAELEEITRLYGGTPYKEIGGQTIKVPQLKKGDHVFSPGSITLPGAKLTKGAKNPVLQANDAFAKAGMLWRKAVLVARPAWYVNNELFNIASSVTSGGLKALKHRFGAVDELLRLGVTDEMLEAVDGMSILGTKVGFASRQERSSRRGLYLALRNQGLDHNKALKELNKALFDYGNLKNYERPLRAVMPFWLWQKNITKRIATMPFDNPRGANAWGTIYSKLYEEPLDKLPDETLEFETRDGETVTYNPREANTGKMYNPITKEWMNTPFNAFTPQSLEQIGISPVIRAWNEYQTNRDYWGNRLDARKWWENITEQFPQYGLAKALIDSNRQQGGVFADLFGAIDNKEQWLAEGSGFTKEMQGLDPDAPNYSANLDLKAKAGAKIKSYMGIPKSKPFDYEKFERQKKEIAFRKDWFEQDWTNKNKDFWIEKEVYDPKTKTYNTELAYDYPTMAKAQEEFASQDKYGYDLQKDVYGTSTSTGLFNRNDSVWTQGVKKQKEEARAFVDATYDDLEKIADANTAPDGSKIDPYSAEGTKYIQNKRLEWEKNQTFIKNPEIKNFLQDWWFRGPDTNYKGLDLTDPNKYLEYREWIDSGGALREAQEVGLAKYKASPKGQFWDEYHRLKGVDPEKASAYYQKYFKPEYESELKPGEVRYRDTDKGKFWDEYHKLREQDPDKASKYYKDNYKDEYGGKEKTPEQQKEISFWQKYFKSSPVVQAKMKEAEPQYFKKKFKKRTWAEIDEDRETRRAERLRKLRTIEGFSARREAAARGINRKAEKAFLGQKKLSPKWKVR